LTFFLYEPFRFLSCFRQSKTPTTVALDSIRFVEWGVGLYCPMANRTIIWLQGNKPEPPHHRASCKESDRSSVSESSTRKSLARRLCLQPYVRGFSMYSCVKPSYIAQYATSLLSQISESLPSISIPVHRPHDFGA